MQDELKLDIFIFSMFFILAYISGITVAYYHESVHQQIFAHYGIDSETHIRYWAMDGYTQVTNMTQFDMYCTPECKLAQSQTEIVGYHLSAAIFIFWLMVLLLILVVRLHAIFY